MNFGALIPSLRETEIPLAADLPGELGGAVTSVANHDAGVGAGWSVTVWKSSTACLNAQLDAEEHQSSLGIIG